MRSCRRFEISQRPSLRPPLQATGGVKNQMHCSSDNVLGGCPRSGQGRRVNQEIENKYLTGSKLDLKYSVSGIMESLNETMKKSQLPKLELSTFEGDSLEFQQRLIYFEKLI